MSIFKNMMEHIKRSKEANEATVDNVSSNTSNHLHHQETTEEITLESVEVGNPAKKMVRKTAVLGTIAVVSVIAIVTGFQQGSDSPSKKNLTLQETGASNHTEVKPSNTTPSSYAELSKYEKNKQTPTKSDASLPSKAGTPSSYQEMGTTNSSPYTTSSPNYSYSNDYSNYNASGNTSPTPTYVKEVSYDSAIRFALNSISPTTSSPTETAVFSNERRAVTTSYSQQTYVLHQGTLVPITLISGITSSLSGQVTALVRENVFDSIMGNAILIPIGSKLIGSYASDKNSQGRISVSFSRIIFPNGSSIYLKNANAVDSMGFAGVKDRYTEHEGKALGAAFITSLLAGVAGMASDGSSSDKRGHGQNAIDEAIGNLISTSNKIVEKRLEASPTATIRPGFECNVMLTNDIYLGAYE